MPKRNELLEKQRIRRQEEKQKARLLTQITSALPEDLEVAEVYVSIPTHLSKRANCQGAIIIHVKTFMQALALTQTLRPADVSIITMQREEQGFIRTTSFYPNGNVPATWHTEHVVIPVYPIIFQAQPKSGAIGKVQGATVFLEWFIEVAQNVYANVRVHVEQNGVRYLDRHFGTSARPDWDVSGLPRGDRRSLRVNQTDRPNITIFWWPNTFNEDWTMGHLFAEREEVAHV
jgi:hypothetical protein